jgi:hypothetical protein
MPAGVPRMAADFAWRLVQYPTTKPTHVFLLYEGNMHSFRQIFEYICIENNQYGLHGGHD